LSTFRKQADNAPGDQSGFTLMEVLIAFAIVSISFVLIMQLFAGGLRASRTSCDYTRAVVYAKDKMGEQLVNPNEGDGEYEDGFKWQAVVEHYKEPEEASFNLMKLKVIVSWSDGARKERKVEFVSLKTLASEESM
jgi:general secretion pathway protein I